MRWRRAWRGSGVARWLLPASVLHAVVALMAAALSPRAAPVRARAPQPSALESEASIELALLGDATPAAGAAPIDGVPAGAPLAARVAINVVRSGAARAGSEAAPSSTAAKVEAVSGATSSLPEGDEPPAPAPVGNEREAGPSLSLDQLGVGANPFLGVAIEPLSKEQLANARLQAALHPASVSRDHSHGLGPAGPVVDATRRLVLADDGLTETSAVLNVRVDGAGRITEVQVLEASSQVAAWQMIAARLAKALGTAALPTGGSGHGWNMKLRADSSVRLPSGAAPGMRLGVLGQQVAGSGGPGSTSLELSPTAKLDLPEPIDATGQQRDRPMRFEVGLLKLRADPTDIGAAARRVVELAVLSLDPAPTP